MDFMKAYDARGAAETPIELELRDPATGDVIMNGKKPCIVLIKGATSRSVQEGLRQEALERARKAKAANGGAGDEPEARVVADLHEDSIKSALRLIAGFKNIETGDGDGLRPLTLDDAQAFLDLNFFSMAHIMRKPGDDAWHGASFAQQIVDAATEDARFLRTRKTA